MLTVRRGSPADVLRRRADAIDDAAEIAVADRLAVLAERDHRVVDLRRARRCVSVKPSASQRRCTAWRPEWRPSTSRVGGLADVLRPHDLVGARVLQHAVLVDAGFVRERVAADDRLVRLHRLAR